MADTIEHDIDGFVQRLKKKEFTIRKDAEEYLRTSTAKTELELAIEAFKKEDDEKATHLYRDLKAKIANALLEIERGGQHLH